ncbi:MAG: zf-HC2 domain-containing protein [Actinomycetota bacterium]|nr:zf-HC2 domain-containing protein [Actinomycetota bacterium]
MAELRCQELVELVTAYLEGTLGPEDQRRIAKHLDQCDACVRYIEQMRVTLGLLGTVPVDTLSPEAQSTLLAAFRDLKR